MPFRKATAAMATALAVAMAGSLSSCSQATPQPPAPSPVKQVHALAYSAAIADLKDYLEVWNQHGGQATKRFIAPTERGPNSLVLRNGKVLSYRPYRWVSQDNFTLFVNLDLYFIGFSGAWNPGPNGRFITFTRPAGQRHYLMYFATSP